jgi:hypothetical protein
MIPHSQYQYQRISLAARRGKTAEEKPQPVRVLNFRCFCDGFHIPLVGFADCRLDFMAAEPQPEFHFGRQSSLPQFNTLFKSAARRPRVSLTGNIGYEMCGFT